MRIVLGIMIALTMSVAVYAASTMILVTADAAKPGEQGLDVRARLGDPSSTVGPVGYPAIERWQYADGANVVLLDGVVVDAFRQVQ